MKKNVMFSNLFFFLSIGISLFSFNACEKIEESDPILMEDQLLKKSSVPAFLNTLPNILVNTTSDVIDFTGSQLVVDLPGPDGLISLREAMTAANNTPGPHYIGFNIPVNDIGFNGIVFTIKPTIGLPGLNNNGITIDGGTQTFFTGNTNPLGPEIVLDGSLAGETGGIGVRSDRITIRSLVIHSFKESGIGFCEDSTWTHPKNVQISGCYIGTDETGSIAMGNGWQGIAATGTLNIIGGSKPSDGNLISGNCAITAQGEIQFDGSYNLIQNNKIGTDRTGNIPLGQNCGIVLGVNVRSMNNTIKDNLISGNAGNAIAIERFNSTGNTISRNRIFSNGDIGIDLNRDGVTLNDKNDNDIGTNNLMNFPVLYSANTTPGMLIVNGIIDTPHPQTITIEFFANPVPYPGGDPSGYGEGAIFLGAKRPNPNGKFTVALPPVASGTMISATATDAEGNTSEFSANIKAKKIGY